MKICYLIPGCGVSGGIAVICQHANRLKSRGHEVYLVVDGAAEEMSWFPGQSVPVVSMAEYPSDVDILIATAWSTAFRVPLLPARRHFYFVQSDETRFHPENSGWQHITRLSYTLGFQYLTEARWIKNWLHQSFGYEATLVPNGLDDAIFYPCEPLEPKKGRPRILLEGAIGLPYKGMREAFLAVQDLDAEIWCVSSYGKPEPGWRCDRFFESVPMSEMCRIYSSCDILLKLSRVEGFFGPPMEMMACGGAVVVGRVTGYDEYIVENENALVVDALDINEAREAVQKLISDTGLRDRLIANGKSTAKKWAWEPFIDKLEKSLEASLLNEQQAMSGPQKEIARSVSFFYSQLRGETIVQAPQNTEVKPSEDNASQPTAPEAAISVEIDPTEKLIGRLRTQRWFRLVAKLAYRLYGRYVRLRSS